MLERYGRTLSGPAFRHFGVVLQANAVAPAEPFAPVDQYQVPDCLSDDEPNFIGGLEVDVRNYMVGVETRDQAFLYLGVARVGVQVVRFDGHTGVLSPVGIIQTPGDASGMVIKEYPQGSSYEKLLFLADYDGGVRVYHD